LTDLAIRIETSCLLFVYNYMLNNKIHVLLIMHLLDTMWILFCNTTLSSANVSILTAEKNFSVSSFARIWS